MGKSTKMHRNEGNDSLPSFSNFPLTTYYQRLTYHHPPFIPRYPRKTHHFAPTITTFPTAASSLFRKPAFTNIVVDHVEHDVADLLFP